MSRMLNPDDLMKELYMIKIGGGSITDQGKPRTAKRDVISRLLKEINEAKNEKGFDIIIGHGGGSFPHVTAKEYKVNEGLVAENSLKGASLTKAMADELDAIVVDEALKLGMPVFPFSPSSFGLSDGKRIGSGFVEQIKVAIANGFIPIVYGDVMMDSKQGVSIASTEEIMRFISRSIPPKEVVLATDVDGVYDKDPSKYDGAKLIESVNSSNIEQIMSSTEGAGKVDVTGGMKTKISTLYEIVKGSAGCTGYIANAQTAGAIKGILLGNKTVRCTEVSDD